MRRVSFFTLCGSLALAGLLSGIHAEWNLWVYAALAAGLLGAIGLSAWAVGGFALAGRHSVPRKLALAGVLLVAPLALLALLPGTGGPELAQHWQSQLRAATFFCNAMFAGAGLLILGRALNAAGERLYSTIGFTASLIGAPAYFLWAAIWASAYLIGLSSSASLPPALARVTDLSDVFLFVGLIMTYVAVAAYATALRHTEWLGTKASLALVGTGLFAILALALRGLDPPDAALAMRHWSLLFGFVAGIPEISWVMPALIGVLLLQRAGAPAAGLGM